MVSKDHIVSKQTGPLFERINLDAYIRMKQARGSELCVPNEIKDHPLLGKSIPEIQKPHKVICVSKQWWGGFYLAIRVEDEKGSHSVVHRNINSIHPSITKEFS